MGKVKPTSIPAGFSLKYARKSQSKATSAASFTAHERIASNFPLPLIIALANKARIARLPIPRIYPSRVESAACVPNKTSAPKATATAMIAESLYVLIGTEGVYINLIPTCHYVLFYVLILTVCQQISVYY